MEGIIMKKIIVFVLIISIISSLALLSGCGEKKAGEVRLGLGVYSSISDAADATSDKDGSAAVNVTAAAVLIGGDGKIVACKIDAVQNNAKFGTAGEYVRVEIAKTKSE